VDDTSTYWQLRSAFSLWSNASSLTFRDVGTSQPADIDISFVSGYHNDGSPFDGQGNAMYKKFSQRQRSANRCVQERSQEFANGGTSRRSGGRNSAAGSSGRASEGVWRRSPQKLETNVHVDFENKQNRGIFLHNFSLLLPVY